MLTLHIVRGPLDENLNLAVLHGYTALTRATVTAENFRRWMQRSPEGPALHAVLKNQNGDVAGHCCLFPFPLTVSGNRVTAAKAEYFFVKSEFRKQAVLGYEGSMKPAAVLLLECLYRSGKQLGWCPYVVSAPSDVAPLHRLAGCRKLTVPLTECLLTFRPWKAAIDTPICRRASEWRSPGLAHCSASLGLSGQNHIRSFVRFLPTHLQRIADQSRVLACPAIRIF